MQIYIYAQTAGLQCPRLHFAPSFPIHLFYNVKFYICFIRRLSKERKEACFINSNNLYIAKKPFIMFL